MSKNSKSPTAQSDHHIPAGVWLACIALTLFKLWSTGGQKLTAFGIGVYDDYHFLRQALHLVNWQWLGPYDQLTLIKGPFLPLWIVLAFGLGIPLLFASQLLYAFSCGALTLALRPILRRNLWIPVLFGILLFNPQSSSLTRVLRELISPSLTMLVAACALGLLLAQQRDSRTGASWGWGLGCSFLALWLTREEQAVVAPFLLLAAGYSILNAWKSGGTRNVRGALCVWMVPVGIFIAGALAVGSINFAKYGLFAKTEFDAPSFKAAYGALSRVVPDTYKPLVPVTTETRRRIYRVSPAFRELRPYLEGQVGQLFEQGGEYMQDATNQDEILGAWWPWALRSAINEAGYYGQSKYPDEYYSRLATEVDEACDQRVLECYGRRASMSPVWRFAYIRPWASSFANKVIEIVVFRAVNLQPIPSVGMPEELDLFRDLTGEDLSPAQQYVISIEAVAANGGLEFRIKDGNGDPVTFRLDKSASPEFGAYLAAHDKAWPGTADAKYLVVVNCTAECVLEIRAAGVLRDTITFGKLAPNVGIIEKADLVYRIAAVEAPSTQAPVELRTNLDRLRIATLKVIRSVYQILGPILGVLGFLAYCWLTWMLTRQGDRLGWIVISGLGILFLVRVALIALIDVSSFRIPAGSYLYEAYPMFLTSASVACMSVLDGLWPGSSRVSKKRQGRGHSKRPVQGEGS